jgi:hypothetical protein
VRSSPFSSSETPASGALGRMWWVALLVAGVLLVGAELGWRRRGFQPTVKDTPELWSLARAQASAGDGRATVLLGSSRFQVGLVPEELSRALGGARVVQLSINGSSSLPLLEDLAADEHFRGLVLCEVSPTLFFSVEPNEVRTAAYRYTAGYGHRTLVADWEEAMRVLFQERLVVLQSSVQPKIVLHSLLVNRSPPVPPTTRTLANRQQQSDFEGVDLKPLRESWEQRFQSTHGREPEPAELEALLGRVSSLVDRIRARGGEVVFVRMVTSGGVRNIEDTRYPRERYWDRLLQRTGGKGITFEDVPALARFECPEGSHLDYRAAPEYTRLLARELVRAAPGAVATEAR